MNKFAVLIGILIALATGVVGTVKFIRAEVLSEVTNQVSPMVKDLKIVMGTQNVHSELLNKILLHLAKVGP